MSEDFTTCQFKDCTVQPPAFRGWWDKHLCEVHYWIVCEAFAKFQGKYFKESKDKK